MHPSFFADKATDKVAEDSRLAGSSSGLQDEALKDAFAKQANAEVSESESLALLKAHRSENVFPGLSSEERDNGLGRVLFRSEEVERLHRRDTLLRIDRLAAENPYYRKESLPNNGRLRVGDEVNVKLDVSSARYSSGVVVMPGEKYIITGSGTWQDGDLPPCGPEGFDSNSLEWWRRPIFGSARPFREVGTGSRWCSLIVATNGGKFEEIGTKLPIVYEAKQAGVLNFAVNDVVFGNNKGTLNINIRRVSAK